MQKLIDIFKEYLNSIKVLKEMLDGHIPKINYKLTFFLSLIILIIYLSNALYEEKTREYKDKEYKNVYTNIIKQTDLLINEKSNTSMLAVISLSKNPKVIRAAVRSNKSIDFNEFSAQVEDESSFKNIWFMITNKKGIVTQRSWSDLRDDDISKYIPELDFIMKERRPHTILNVNKYDLVFSSIAPIEYKQKVIGTVSVITNFNTITDILKKDNFSLVVLLDEINTKRLDRKNTMASKFIEKRYVANSNAQTVNIKLIRDIGTNAYQGTEKTYRIHEDINMFEALYPLKDSSGLTIGVLVLMKSLHDIDMGDLEILQTLHIVMTIFLIITLSVIRYFINLQIQLFTAKSENKKIYLNNIKLLDENEQLDFKEKRIANIFHIQPNFVILSDGVKIDNANERMIWLLNGDTGGIADIQAKYTDIAQTFEESENKSIDLSDYISSTKIDDVNWMDYILDNFKRDYKTCIRDTYGNQHHFIIKMNEMKYVKNVKRYIIISFMDITKDIPKEGI